MLALADRREGPKQGRNDGEKYDDLPPLVDHAGESRQHDPRRDCDRRHFRRGSEEGRHRRRRALVNVGRPHMEGRRRHFESETRQNEHETEDHANRRRVGDDRRDALERHRPRKAIEQRRTIKHHARRQRAENEIFETRFRGASIVARKGGDDIERQGHQFEAEIKRDEVIRRDQQQHAERGQQDQDRIFEFIERGAAQEIRRQQDRHQRRAERQHLNEARESVVDIGAVEDDRLGFRRQQDRQYRQPQHGDGQFGHQRERALAAPSAHQNERENADGEDDLRQEVMRELREKGHLY